MRLKNNWILWIAALLVAACQNEPTEENLGPTRFSLVDSEQSNITFSNKVENQKEQGDKVTINPYDQIPLKRRLIDKKNSKVGIFDLGNHILIAGVILLVIFVSLNVE